MQRLVITQSQVSAVGKYCYVVPSEEELDFGNQIIPTLGVGTVDNQRYPRLDFTLRNQSVVPASFVVRARVTAKCLTSILDISRMATMLGYMTWRDPSHSRSFTLFVTISDPAG